MTRQEAVQALMPIKEQLLSQVGEKVKSRHIHGERMDVIIGGKVHRMLHYPGGKEKAPVYFDIHGGGMCWGMMEEGDLLCHRMNEQLGIEVYALDYPLVPDAFFPEGLNWLYDTVSHLVAHKEEFHLDPDRMIVGGRSAGGNLSAALSIMARDRGEFHFACQVLDHPVLDMGLGIVDESSRYYGEGALPKELVDLLSTAYCTEEEKKSLYCSPLNASTEELKGLPPAVIQTCELDCLRPDGDLYAARLKEAGVPVISHCYMGVLHGFTEVEGPEEKNGQQYLIDGIRTLMKL